MAIKKDFMSEFFLVDTDDVYCWRIKGLINNSMYQMDFHTYYLNNSLRIYVALSSGKKRKELDYSGLYKTNNSDGGLKTLVWCKNQIKKFIEEHKSLVRYYNDMESIYIIVGWDDKKRREIYKAKLKDLGFYMTHDLGSKCLKLKVK